MNVFSYFVFTGGRILRFPSYCTTVITPSFTGVKILVDLNPHNSCVVRAGVLRLKHMLHCPTRSLDVASATLDQF